MADYTIHEHSHRFAVWAAGRAYARGGKGGGYTVPAAKRMIEAAGLRDIKNVDDLPDSAAMDAFVHGLIKAVIAARPLTYAHPIAKKGNVPARKETRPFVFTYGRAQKLVNIYLKSKIICGGAPPDDERVASLHPPLDRQLLDALNRLGPKQLGERRYKAFRKKWNIALIRGANWTDFDESTYNAYLLAIKTLQGERPLWAVEEHWMGA